MSANTSSSEEDAKGWGPISRYVAANVARIRTARGLSTTRLSAALKEIGASIPATGITRIEKGERRVDTDDLVALAKVLNVSPLNLLLPEEGPCHVAPNVTTTPEQAWRWASGEGPLRTDSGEPIDFDDRLDYFKLLPRWKQALERHRLAEPDEDEHVL